MISSLCIIGYRYNVMYIVHKEIRKENWVTITVNATGSLIAPLQKTLNKILSGHIFFIPISC